MYSFDEHCFLVYLVLTKFADASKVNLSYFVDETSVPKIPGYIDHRTISLDPRSFQEVTFDQLHPVTSYSVSAVINLSSLITKPKPNEVPYVVDTSKIQTVWNFGVETLEEQLDIEWWRLDQNMRVTELRAAVRSEFVQMKAHHNYPPILLPSDDDLLSSECMHVLNLQMDSPQLSGAKKKLKPHLLLFYDWWVGSGRKTTKVRSEFHSLECIHAIVHHKSFMHEFLEEGFADSDECQVLVDYVKKQTNPRRASISAPSDIQKIRSSISAAADDMMSMKSTVSGASNMSAIMNEKGLQLMKRFRSWYKGGQVVKDFEETEHKRLTTLLPSDDEQSTYSTTSEGSAVDVVEHESLCTKRLVQRNKFLVQLIKQVQDCTTQVSRLHDGYKYAVTKSLKESDLMYERANLSNKVRPANLISIIDKLIEIFII